MTQSLKTIRLAGHKLVITARHEAHNHRQAATYEAQCECGQWSQVWPDRLTVVRGLHRDHCRAVKKGDTK